MHVNINGGKFNVDGQPELEVRYDDFISGSDIRSVMHLQSQDGDKPELSGKFNLMGIVGRGIQKDFQNIQQETQQNALDPLYATPQSQRSNEMNAVERADKSLEVLD